MSNETKTNGGANADAKAKSSPVRALGLIPLHALERLALRYEIGRKKYGENSYLKHIDHLDYVIERLEHVLIHTYRLIEKLRNARDLQQELKSFNDEKHTADAQHRISRISRISNLMLEDERYFDDDAGAIMWGGALAAVATDKLVASYRTKPLIEDAEAELYRSEEDLKQNNRSVPVDPSRITPVVPRTYAKGTL